MQGFVGVPTFFSVALAIVAWVLCVPAGDPSRPAAAADQGLGDRATVAERLLPESWPSGGEAGPCSEFSLLLATSDPVDEPSRKRLQGASPKATAWLHENDPADVPEAVNPCPSPPVPPCRGQGAARFRLPRAPPPFRPCGDLS